MRMVAAVASLLTFAIFLASVHSTMGEIILKDRDGDLLHAAKTPYVQFPTNKTYYSGLQTLNISFDALIVGNVNYSASYSLDGGKNVTLALIHHYFGFFPQTGHPEKNYVDGSVALPPLDNGSHQITVYIEGMYWGSRSYYYSDLDSQTIHFSIISPLVLLMEEVYNSSEIPLIFYANDTATQISYSLDNQANVTISGNTTLTGLTEGLHSINVYTPNEEGHWVNFDTATFTVTKPVPSPTPTLLLLIGTPLLVPMAMYHYSIFKKRKAKGLSNTLICFVKKRDCVKSLL